MTVDTNKENITTKKEEEKEIKNTLEPLMITKDTRDILEVLKKELTNIYWEDIKSDDDIILYLYSYYCQL